MEIPGSHHSWLLDSIHKTWPFLPALICSRTLAEPVEVIANAKCVGSFNIVRKWFGALNRTMIFKACAQPRLMLTKG